jgi:hypothetical protein
MKGLQAESTGAEAYRDSPARGAKASSGTHQRPGNALKVYDVVEILKGYLRRRRKMSLNKLHKELYKALEDVLGRKIFLKT